MTAISSGMPVISTTRARHSPIPAPTAVATTMSTRPVALMLREASAMVAASAMTMPAMPETMPEREVRCCESPARLRMNISAATT